MFPIGARKLTTAGPARLINLLKSGNADVQSVEKLLEEGCDLNQLIEVSLRKSVTPLMVACELGQVDIVKLLLERGAEVDKHGSECWTALIVAVVSENVEVVKVLVEHGADVDYAVGWGDKVNKAKSPLLLACEKGLVIMVKAMLPKSKCKFMYTAYIYAMEGGHNEVAQLLLSEVSEVEANAMRLGFFCREGMFAEAKKLLEGNHESPFIDYILEGSTSPLVEASDKGQNKIVELLLDNGANVNLQTGNGITPVMVAVKMGHTEVVSLLAANCNIDSQDSNRLGWTPLMYAIKLPQTENNEDAVSIMKMEEAVDKNNKISRKLAHGILVGPTGSGKSSLMERLLGRSTKKFSPSTGVSEPVVVVDIDIDNPSTFHSVTVMDHNTWTEVEYDISLLRQMDEGVITSQSDNTSTSPPPAKRAKIESETAPDAVLVSTSPQQSLRGTDTPAKVLPTAEIIRRVIKEFGGYKKFKHFLKKSFSLYLRDTGGQVEFQEIMPLLIFGPSIVFFVFRLDLDFKKKFEVKYRKSVDESLNCYISSITTEEAFLQSLATVDAMDMSGEASVKTHKPLVFIIGTHRDKLGPSADKKIAELNEYLSLLIENSGFRDLVQYSDRRKGHVVFTVDNTSENDEDFKLIRSRVSNMICGREEFTIEYPIRFLLFSLELQNSKCSILSFDECKVMAAKCGIEEDQLVHLLQFLHLRIGVIRYFNKDGVRHIVIKEPQVLFNNVTDLIIKTFSCEALTDTEVEDFEKKGILTASVLATALKGLGDITPEEFLQLLVHLRITAPFSVSSEIKRYFFPSVLNHVSESTEEEPSTEILPLAVTFKCGHCPKGLFGVLVTHLMTPDLNEGATSHTTTFILMQDRIFKDQVSFEVHSPGVHDEMALKLHPSHLEIKFFPEHSEDRCTSITEVCSNVRQIVETSIHQSLQDLHYSESKVAPVTCFRCEDCSELHEVQIRKQLVKMHCKKTRTTQSIPDQGKWWYREALTSNSVKRFLRRLPRQQIKEVGCCLGLQDSCMSTVDELITSWLSGREGQDTASWEHLVKALDRTGHKEIASSIKKELDLTVSDDPPVTTETTSVSLTHPAVRKFLKPLSNKELREVGLELGLHWPHLKKMSEDCLLDDMLDSWLRADDDVIKTSGHPSWQSLVKALEETGCTGVATSVKQKI